MTVRLSESMQNDIKPVLKEVKIMKKVKLKEPFQN